MSWGIVTIGITSSLVRYWISDFCKTLGASILKFSNPTLSAHWKTSLVPTFGRLRSRSCCYLAALTMSPDPKFANHTSTSPLSTQHIPPTSTPSTCHHSLFPKPRSPISSYGSTRIRSPTLPYPRTCSISRSIRISTPSSIPTRRRRRSLILFNLRLCRPSVLLPFSNHHPSMLLPLLFSSPSMLLADRGCSPPLLLFRSRSRLSGTLRLSAFCGVGAWKPTVRAHRDECGTARWCESV